MTYGNHKRLAQVRDDLTIESIDDDLVVLDKMHGQIHQFNLTASVIWHAIAAGQDSHTIAASLVEQFGVSIETALSDLEMVVGQFASLNLLVDEC
jgi:hypothetical protein